MIDKGSISSTFFSTQADSKSVKIDSSHQYHFALLGYAHLKAAGKMLVKLTQAWFIFHLWHPT